MLSIYEKIYGADDENLVEFLCNYSDCETRNGNYKIAQELLNKALTIIDMNNLLGDAHAKYTTNPKKADILFDFGN